jgi:hypothetical protein
MTRQWTRIDAAAQAYVALAGALDAGLVPSSA